MKNLIYLLLCTLTLSCNIAIQEEPEWGVFKISKAICKGKPLVGSINQFEDIFKNPSSKVDSCMSIGIYPNGGHYWIYDCIIPKTK